MNRSARLLAPLWLLLILAGCSSSPKPAGSAKPQPSPPPQPVSGATAFYKIFFSARAWARDAEPLRLAQIDVDEIKAADGKAAAWEAVFVSASERSSRRYIYSVIHRPARNLRGGVTSDPPESWSASGGAEPFLVQALKTDSTSAYQTALKKGSEYARKHPDMPVKLLLEKTNRFPGPAWRIYWGESVSTSAYSVFVDAATGEYLATGR
ncbi:MAG TPA: hypothetical protein VF767_11325 [Bryobacteraceae bacterium]